MKALHWLAIPVGLAALAGCDTGDETNVTNIEVNAVDDNLALPPVDMNADLNADMNADMNGADNMTDNVTNNSVNAY